MSGKRPEGRSPEANILASPKYSKTHPSAASEPPVSPSGPKSRTEPLTTISVLPRTAHRRGRFRKERKPQPDRKRPRLRSGKRTRLSYRSGDRRTTGPDPRDTVRPPRPARHTPETSRRNVLRRCPFHKYPKRLPFPTEERPPHRTRETPRRPPPGTNVRPDRNAAASACRTSPGKESPGPCTKRQQDRQTDCRSVAPSPEPQQKKAHGRTSAGPRSTDIP